jgi:hypothetical protein
MLLLLVEGVRGSTWLLRMVDVAIVAAVAREG